jgi:predicted nucleotidyltransferase
MVKLKMYKKIISDYLKSEIQALRAVIIFGSFANNSENKYSDIDIAFLIFKKNFKYTKMEITGRISLNFRQRCRFG